MLTLTPPFLIALCSIFAAAASTAAFDSQQELPLFISPALHQINPRARTCAICFPPRLVPPCRSFAAAVKRYNRRGTGSGTIVRLFPKLFPNSPKGEARLACMRELRPTKPPAPSPSPVVSPSPSESSIPSLSPSVSSSMPPSSSPTASSSFVPPPSPSVTSSSIPSASPSAPPPSPSVSFVPSTSPVSIPSPSAILPPSSSPDATPSPLISVAIPSVDPSSSPATSLTPETATEFQPSLPPRFNLLILSNDIEVEVNRSFTRPGDNLTVTSELVNSSVPGFPFKQFPKFIWPGMETPSPTPSIWPSPSPFFGRERPPPTRFLSDYVSLRVTITSCGRVNCAAKVDIFATRFIRREIIKRAIARVRAAGNFEVVYNTDSDLFRIIRRSHRKFTVIVPFRNNYLSSFFR